MTAACRVFRDALARALEARAGSASIAPVAWHEHLLACGDCRELLAAEEALEELLASLPEPRLPAALARRVLLRLATVRESEASLDALLDEVGDDAAPAGIAQRVLAKIKEERALDRLLDRVRPAHAPAGLVERVLAGLAAERGLAVEPAASPRFALRRPAVWLYALAATLAVALGALAWLRSTPRVEPVAPGPVAGGNEPAPRRDVEVESPALVHNEPAPPVEPGPNAIPNVIDDPPPELLASLDLLESWEVLASGDLDLELGSLDGFDEVLLGIEAELGQNDTGATEPPTKG